MYTTKFHNLHIAGLDFWTISYISYWLQNQGSLTDLFRGSTSKAYNNNVEYGGKRRRQRVVWELILSDNLSPWGSTHVSNNPASMTLWTLLLNFNFHDATTCLYTLVLTDRMLLRKQCVLCVLCAKNYVQKVLTSRHS